jgi:hypothetical protein
MGTGYRIHRRSAAVPVGPGADVPPLTRLAHNIARRVARCRWARLSTVRISGSEIGAFPIHTRVTNHC